MASLTRDDMIDGLTEVIRRLHERGAHATIRIVGGAAMMLRYFEDRRVTPDIDASIHTDADLGELIDEIAMQRGWPPDWLNTAAAADNADDAERVFEEQYLGELPPERACAMLDDIFAVGLPDVRLPSVIDLSSDQGH